MEDLRYTIGCPSTKCLEQTRLSSSLGCQFFPVLGYSSIDGFNPLFSPFRVSFKCWKGIKLKQYSSGHVVPTCTMAIMRRTNSPPPFLQLICTATARKNHFPRNFLSQNTAFFDRVRHRDYAGILLLATNFNFFYVRPKRPKSGVG